MKKSLEASHVTDNHYDKDDFEDSEEESFLSFIYKLLEQRAAPELDAALQKFFKNLRKYENSYFIREHTVWVGANVRMLPTLVLTFYVAVSQQRPFSDKQKDKQDDLTAQFETEMLPLARKSQLILELQFVTVTPGAEYVAVVEEMRMIIEEEGFTPISQYEPLT